MNILKSCMLVNVHVNTWGGQKKLADEAKEAARRANADEDATKLSVLLVKPEDLKPIGQARTALKSHFYDNTLPWKDNGDRLLPKKRYEKFIQKHSELEKAFYDAVDHFVDDVYEKARAQAEFRLGSFFDASLYPSTRYLRSRFKVKLAIDSVTDSNDFRRVELDEVISKTIRRDIDAEYEARTRQTVTHMMEKIQHALTAFHTQTGKPDGKIYNSLTENLADVVDGLADFNITGDPVLDELRKDIDKKLGRYAADDLRKQPEVRQEAHAAATEIMDKMASFMSAFGQAA